MKTRKSSVIIVPFNAEEGILFGESQNPDYKRMRVQSKTIVSTGSLFYPQTRIHTMTISNELLAEMELKEGYDLTNDFPEARISIIEREGEPFWKTEDRVQSPKLTPGDEEKGIEAKVHISENGFPIYRNTFLCLSKSDPHYNDVFVPTGKTIPESEFLAMTQNEEVIEGQD